MTITAALCTPARQRKPRRPWTAGWTSTGGEAIAGTRCGQEEAQCPDATRTWVTPQTPCRVGEADTKATSRLAPPTRPVNQVHGQQGCGLRAQGGGGSQGFRACSWGDQNVLELVVTVTHPHGHRRSHWSGHKDSGCHVCESCHNQKRRPGSGGPVTPPWRRELRKPALEGLCEDKAGVAVARFVPNAWLQCWAEPGNLESAPARQITPVPEPCRRPPWSDS